jgi:diaminopimelate decarboxylase
LRRAGLSVEERPARGRAAHPAWAYLAHLAGRIVIDSLDEIATLASLVPARQQVLLRVVPQSMRTRRPG